MTMTKIVRTSTAAAGLAATLLLASGCSSHDSDRQDHGAPAPSASTPDTRAAVIQTARSYQEAALRQDWRAACGLSTARLRGGSVEDCIKASTASTPSPGTSSTPTPEADPPRYADGSTPKPRATHTTGGPDRADTGPVTASAADLVKAPAAGDHPAGWGALVTYTVTWPGKPPTTSRNALRLVDEGGTWRVDQYEDVQAGDEGHGSPVLAALGG
ncbi:hypothetical protein [Streptomyces violascens]|uniref:hypothetical protein n=1 Tax=Streptomyces violascens TaxID=67381 RepID=UPI001676AECA|nr:hypothetical protein [Streptomyces violascens]GGU49979.1 hypothetical protein GCM10010289_83090 [Streptomyces violascens]